MDWTAYWDDAGPQSFFDGILNGKLATLGAFCELYGWSDLAAHLNEITPVRGTAPESLERVRGFVIPEVRYRVATMEIGPGRIRNPLPSNSNMTPH